MRRLATITAFTIAIVFGAGGIALATGNGNGGNSGSNPNQPSNPPCDSDSHEVRLPLGLMDKCGDNGGGVHLCPPSSPNAGATPPNCGNGVGGTGVHLCPESSPNPDGVPPNCGNGNGGGGDDGNGGGGGGGGGGTPPPDDGGGAGTTCSTGGLADGTGLPLLTDPGTLLNKDKNEAGPLSGQLHGQLEPAIDGLAPVVHEVNCDVVVTLGL